MLSNTIDELQRQMEAIKDDHLKVLSSKDVEIKSLKESINRLDNTVLGSLQERDDAISVRDKVVLKLREVANTLKTLTTEKDDMNRRIEFLESEKKEFTRHIDSVTAERDSAIKHANILQEELQTLYNTTFDESHTNVMNHEYLAIHKSQIERLEMKHVEELQTKDNEINALQVENNKTTAKLKKVVGALKSLHDDKGQLTERCQTLQALLDERHASNDSSNEEKNDTKKLEEELSSSEASLDQVHQEMEKMRSDFSVIVSSKDAESAELRSRLEQLDALGATTLRERDELAEVRDKLMSKLRELAASLKASSEEKEHLNGRCASLQASLDDRSRGDESLSEALGHLRAENDALRVRGLSLAEEVKASQACLEGVRSEYEAERAEKASLLEDRAGLQSKFDRVVAKLKEVLLSFNEKCKECETALFELNKAKEESASLKSCSLDNDILKSTILQLAEEKKGLLERSSAQQTDIDLLRKNVDDVVSNHSLQSEEQLKVLQQQYQDILVDVSNKDVAIGELRQQLSDITENVKSLNADLEKCKNDRNKAIIKLKESIQAINDKNTVIDALEKDSINLKVRITTLESEVEERGSALSSEHANLEDTLREKNDSIHILNQYLETYRIEKEDLQNEKKQVTSLLRNAQSTIETMQNVAEEHELKLIKLSEFQMLNSKLQDEISELKSVIDERDMQLSSYELHVSHITEELKLTRNKHKQVELSLETAQRENSDFRDKAASKYPKSFEVVQRCEYKPTSNTHVADNRDDVQMWCLVRRLDTSTLEWFTETDVLEEFPRDEVSSANGFSIDAHEVELPMSVQDSLRAYYEREIYSYQGNIQQLQLELENSQKAFDVYRDRARASLKKTAADQQKGDIKIAELTEQLKALQVKHNQSSASHSQKERMFQDHIASLRHEIQEEKSASKLIRSEIQLLQREFIDFQVKEKMRIESEIVEKANHQNNDSQKLELQLVDLQTAYESLKLKESQLMLELKKRGDLARSLCTSKDEEIRQLRDKLHYEANKEKMKRGVGGPVALPALAVSSQSSSHAEEGSNGNVSHPPSGEGGGEAHPNIQDEDTDEFKALIDIARNQAFRDIESFRDAKHDAEELAGFKKLALKLVDRNKKLAAEVSRLSRKLEEGSALRIGDTDLAREQRMEYLRHAFSSLFRAHETNEVHHLGRVICTILNYPPEEQNKITADINRTAPGIVASSSTFGDITSQLSYFFSS